MIEFGADKEGLILKYSAEMGGSGWIWEKLKAHDEVRIGRVFTFNRRDLIEEPGQDQDDNEFEYRFRFATRDGPYFRIAGDVFDISNDVLLSDRGLKVDSKLFVAERNISIFRRLAKVVGPEGDIVIGGSRPGNIPIQVFKELLKKFPNSTELNHYANARVANILGEYFDGMKDFRAEYETYLSRRKSVIAKDRVRPLELLQSEIDKFVLIHDTIVQWLKSSDGRTEKEWQQMILRIILLIFPKYVAVLENIRIEDHYTKPGAISPRFIDIALVDANGNIDVIEIKRPFEDVLLSKTQYRDNFIPTKDLSGTIMQAEKYLFHLSKWGVAGEAQLTKRYSGQLPSGMTIHITTPKALLILGRDRKPDDGAALDQRQTFDLEVIKRKYANMMDIITYDDLLRRLNNIIDGLRRRAAAS